MRFQETASLAKRVREQLGERFVVAARPEHPYLLAPPDLMIGGEGLLTAVFSPNSAENRAPKLLRTRLVAARLALPEHARCALLGTEEFIYRASEFLSLDDFEIVLSIDDPRGLADKAANESIRMQRLEELGRQRKVNSERAGRALFLSGVAERFDRLTDEKHNDASWAQEIEFVLFRITTRETPGGTEIKEPGPLRVNRWLYPFHRGEQILMSARTDNRSRGLFLAVQTIFFNEYSLDMGVPYARRGALPIVFPDQKHQAKQSHGTFMRAASLAGLIIGPAGAPRQVEKFIALEEAVRTRQLRKDDLADWYRAH